MKTAGSLPAGPLVACSLAALLAPLALCGCLPSNPPPTPLPTKEKTIDRVKSEIDGAMKKVQETRDAADEPAKKGE